MSAHPRIALTVCALGCGPEPITADTLDKDWTDTIGWPAGDIDQTESQVITDPTGISGDMGATLYGGECVVIWSVAGDRTTCADCTFAFDVDLEVLEDRCGLAGPVSVTMSLNRGAVYIEYTRLAEYVRTGNTITFDSLDDSYGAPAPEPYYDYDYYSSTNTYYGTLRLLGG